MSSNVMREFEALSEKIKIREATTYGCNEIEDLLLEMLNFIKLHPSSRDLFLKYFMNKVIEAEENDLISGECIYLIRIIQFCMRELQWLEIKYAATIRQNKSKNWRIIGIMDGILAVYEDDWQDSDLYEYYSK